MITQFFENYYWMTPEIYLSVSIILLLGLGVVFSRDRKRGKTSLYINGFLFLSFLILFYVLLLFIEELSLLKMPKEPFENFSYPLWGWSNPLTVDTLGGYFNINSFNVLIKIIVIICTLFILLFSLTPFGWSLKQTERQRKTPEGPLRFEGSPQGSPREKTSEKNHMLSASTAATRIWSSRFVDFEYFLLILLAVLGIFLLIGSKDLILLYLSIETVSLSLYVLATIRRTGQFTTEAGLKYFLLGALSSGFLLFGSVIIYFITGLTNFDDLSYYIMTLQEANGFFEHDAGAFDTISALHLSESGVRIAPSALSQDATHLTNATHPLGQMPERNAPEGDLISEDISLLKNFALIKEGLQVGILFILVAFLFKLAASPFHMWAPDVYEGVPTIITAFFAIVPKLGIFMVFIQLLFHPFLGLFSSISQPLLCFSAILSIIIGSLGALNQSKIKRLIAYSAIGHIGFMLLGLAPGTLNSIQAAFIYFFIYIVMSLNTFSLVFSLYNQNPYSSKIFQTSTLGAFSVLKEQNAPLGQLRTHIWHSDNEKHQLDASRLHAEHSNPSGAEHPQLNQQNAEFYSTTNHKSTALHNFTIGKSKTNWHGVSSYLLELKGLSRKEPILAITFSITLLSIAGIPPFAGFFSKYLVFLSIIENPLQMGNIAIILGVIGVLFSVIGSFYYIRIIQFMFFKNPISLRAKNPSGLHAPENTKSALRLREPALRPQIRKTSTSHPLGDLTRIASMKNSKALNAQHHYKEAEHAMIDLFKDFRDIAIGLRGYTNLSAGHKTQNSFEQYGLTPQKETPLGDTKQRRFANKQKISPRLSLNLSLILGASLFIIVTFIFYPNPFLNITSNFIFNSLL